MTQVPPMRRTVERSKHITELYEPKFHSRTGGKTKSTCPCSTETAEPICQSSEPGTLVQPDNKSARASAGGTRPSFEPLMNLRTFNQTPLLCLPDARDGPEHQDSGRRAYRGDHDAFNIIDALVL